MRAYDAEQNLFVTQAPLAIYSGPSIIQTPQAIVKVVHNN